MDDSAGRYNAKWLDIGGLKKGNNDMGGVKIGDFRRGQGGIYCRLVRPYNAYNVPDLFIESEQKRTLIDLGYHDRWEMGKPYQRYQKQLEDEK